jgi:hypothetical protein
MAAQLSNTKVTRQANSKIMIAFSWYWHPSDYLSGNASIKARSAQLVAAAEINWFSS